MPERHSFKLPPELLEYIAVYLDYKSLWQCAAVCWIWYESFYPLAWSAIAIDNLLKNTLKNYGDRADMVDALCTNAHRIRHLHFSSSRALFGQIPVPIRDILVDRCRSLVSIYAQYQNLEEGQMFMQLFALNNDLEDVTLLYCGNKEYEVLDLRFLKWLKEKHQLCRLGIGFELSAADIHAFLDACPTLEELVLHGRTVTSTQTGIPMIPTNMSKGKQRAGESSTVQQHRQTLSFLEQCLDPDLGVLLERNPSVYNLKIRDIEFEICSTSLCRMLEAGRLTHITHLDLSETSPRFVIMDILRATPLHQLSYVALDCDQEEIQLLLERQHQSLKSAMVLYDRYDVHPERLATLAGFLFTCRRLETLCIRTARMLDIRHWLRDPWVCSELCALVVPIAMFEQSGGGDKHDHHHNGQKEEPLSSCHNDDECQRACMDFTTRLHRLNHLQIVDFCMPQTPPDSDFFHFSV